MVFYTTARASNLITAFKKVTLGGKANPSINLASTSVCPVQPVSVTNTVSSMRTPNWPGR